MLDTLKKNWQAQLAVFMFVAYTMWILLIHLYLPKEHILYEFFGHSYGILAIWGAVWGVIIARKWGGLHSLIGKALIMFSLGLLAQEFGQLAYSYYIFVLHIEVPYPSIGDLGFFGTIPFYIAGTYFLAKASGVKVTLGQFSSKLQALIVPLIMLSIGYFLFLQEYAVDWSNPLRVFLDFGYPLGQAIYIAIAILTYSLSRGVLGGVMKYKVLFFLFALVIQFLADYIFIYFQTGYYAASFIDYIYLVAYFLMTMAILQMKTVRDQLRHIEK